MLSIKVVIQADTSGTIPVSIETLCVKHNPLNRNGHALFS